MVAPHDPGTGGDLGTNARHYHTAPGAASLVMANLIRRATEAGNAATILAIFHEARHDPLQLNIERNRLRLVSRQGHAYPRQGFNHLVVQRADIRMIRCHG